jgi:hypothetical protein
MNDFFNIEKKLTNIIDFTESLQNLLIQYPKVKAVI